MFGSGTSTYTVGITFLINLLSHHAKLQLFKTRKSNGFLCKKYVVPQNKKKSY